MRKTETIKEYILDTLQASRFAVLATEGNGQPHASLIAITPFGDFPQIIFATYRDTLKYRNLSGNNKVALLIESGATSIEEVSQSVVLTIIGHTEEINITENEAVYQAHLKRHPQMETFMNSSDCAIFMVIAHSYQVVKDLDDISWITTNDLNAI